MNILGSVPTVPQSTSSTDVAEQKDTKREKRKRISRVQKGLAKRELVKTSNKAQSQGKKVTIQDQITGALHSIKSGTKERIINYLLRDKQPLSKEDMSKLKHNITVVASNMYNSKKLDIKGKEKRSYIYTLPKIEKKLQTA